MSLREWRPVIVFCAEECRRQQSGEPSVAWMLDAWVLALDHTGPVTVDLIVQLGQRIEPVKNVNGFRRTPVFIGYEQMPNADLVPRMVANLVDSGLPPDEWYHQYELIHPFRDGNGRTGKVLYNLMLGRLSMPEFPPDFFGGIGNP